MESSSNLEDESSLERLERELQEQSKKLKEARERIDAKKKADLLAQHDALQAQIQELETEEKGERQRRIDLFAEIETLRKTGAIKPGHNAFNRLYSSELQAIQSQLGHLLGAGSQTVTPRSVANVDFERDRGEWEIEKEFQATQIVLRRMEVEAIQKKRAELERAMEASMAQLEVIDEEVDQVVRADELILQKALDRAELLKNVIHEVAARQQDEPQQQSGPSVTSFSKDAILAYRKAKRDEVSMKRVDAVEHMQKQVQEIEKQLLQNLKSNYGGGHHSNRTPRVEPVAFKSKEDAKMRAEQIQQSVAKRRQEQEKREKQAAHVQSLLTESAAQTSDPTYTWLRGVVMESIGRVRFDISPDEVKRLLQKAEERAGSSGPVRIQDVLLDEGFALSFDTTMDSMLEEEIERQKKELSDHATYLSQTQEKKTKESAFELIALQLASEVSDSMCFEAAREVFKKLNATNEYIENLLVTAICEASEAAREKEKAVEAEKSAAAGKGGKTTTRKGPGVGFMSKRGGPQAPPVVQNSEEEKQRKRDEVRKIYQQLKTYNRDPSAPNAKNFVLRSVPSPYLDKPKTKKKTQDESAEDASAEEAKKDDHDNDDEDDGIHTPLPLSDGSLPPLEKEGEYSRVQTWKVDFEVDYWANVEFDMSTVDTEGAGPITCISFSPNSRLFAAASSKGHLLVWDVFAMPWILVRRHVFAVGLHAEELAWSYDSAQLIVRTAQGQIQVFTLPVPPGDLIMASEEPSDPKSSGGDTTAPPFLPSSVTGDTGGQRWVDKHAKDTRKSGAAFRFKNVPDISSLCFIENEFYMTSSEVVLWSDPDNHAQLGTPPTPSYVTFHPSFTLFATQPCVVVGTTRGRICKFNSKDAVSCIFGKARETIWRDLLEVPASTEPGSSAVRMSREIFKGHTEPVIYCGFPRCNPHLMLTIDSSGCLLFWSYDTKQATQVGHFAPSSLFKITLEVKEQYSLGGPGKWVCAYLIPNTPDAQSRAKDDAAQKTSAGLFRTMMDHDECTVVSKFQRSADTMTYLVTVPATLPFSFSCIDPTASAGGPQPPAKKRMFGRKGPPAPPVDPPRPMPVPTVQAFNVNRSGIIISHFIFPFFPPPQTSDAQSSDPNKGTGAPIDRGRWYEGGGPTTRRFQILQVESTGNGSELLLLAKTDDEYTHVFFYDVDAREFQSRKLLIANPPETGQQSSGASKKPKPKEGVQPGRPIMAVTRYSEMLRSDHLYVLIPSHYFINIYSLSSLLLVRTITLYDLAMPLPRGFAFSTPKMAVSRDKCLIAFTSQTRDEIFVLSTKDNNNDPTDIMPSTPLSPIHGDTRARICPREHWIPPPKLYEVQKVYDILPSTLSQQAAPLQSAPSTPPPQAV